MIPKSYREHVGVQASRTPCVSNVLSFLSPQKARHWPCRVAALDFYVGASRPVLRTAVDACDVLQEVREPNTMEHCDGYAKVKKPLQGKILIIEDLTPDLVENLGYCLDIDPLFFALHLHSARKTGSEFQSPEIAVLPSKLKRNHYASFIYHRAVVFDPASPPKGKLLRNSCVDRKVVVLPSTNIGLAQHCASVIKITRKGNFWLGEQRISAPFYDSPSN